MILAIKLVGWNGDDVHTIAAIASVYAIHVQVANPISTTPPLLPKPP